MNRIPFKTILVGAVAVVLLFIGLPMATTYINPGNIGILIHRTGGGVDSVPLGPGIHVVNPLFSSIEEYPTFMQTLILAKNTNEGSSNNDEINVSSAEGQPIAVDVTLSFELDPQKVPSLYKQFRTELPTITHTYIKQTIRKSLQEAIGQDSITGIIGPKKGAITASVEKLITDRLSVYGFVVKQFTINEWRPPQSIIDAIAKKNAMQQEALTAQNQLAKTRFLASGDSIQATGHANAILIDARARATANQLLQSSATDGVIRLKQVEALQIWAGKWNGTLPATILGNNPMMLQLPNGKN